MVACHECSPLVRIDIIAAERQQLDATLLKVGLQLAYLA